MLKYFKQFSDEIKYSIDNINEIDINKIIKELVKLKKNNGRVFFVGVGGSAANCSHAVNDFRKLCEIETYALTDNVSELTARTNDEGWDSVFIDSLKVSNISKKDILFVLSVGGGSISKNISVNLSKAIKYAKSKDLKILGIVGNKGGYTYKNGDVVIRVKCKNKNLITPIAETFQSVILHYLVSNYLLQVKKTKW